MADTTGFGHDLSCTDDLDPNGLEVDGITTLSQALYRRIITARGGLLGTPDYGLGAPAFIDQEMTSRQVSVLASSIDNELVKDERVFSSLTTGTFANSKFTASTLVTTAQGPFRLTLSISAVTVELLSVTR